MTPWYGASAAWWVPLEAAARRAFGADLTHDYRPERLAYNVQDLHVAGEPPNVAVSVQFWRQPVYDTYGLPAQDFPRVYAEPGVESPHRYPGDDALCLWCPDDPPERRWNSDRGLLDLLEIIRRHLFLERYWRMTGGRRKGVWLMKDAPHGFDGAA